MNKNKYSKDANFLLNKIWESKDKFVMVKDYLDLNNIKLNHLYRVQLDEDGAEWKGETKDGKYIIMRVSSNFVGIGLADTTYERDTNIKIIGLGNSSLDLREISTLAKELNIEIPEDYYEFDWN